MNNYIDKIHQLLNEIENMNLADTKAFKLKLQEIEKVMSQMQINYGHVRHPKSLMELKTRQVPTTAYCVIATAICYAVLATTFYMLGDQQPVTPTRTNTIILTP